jgi:hypothetical protein
VAIIEKAYGPDDRRLVEPLNDIASSYEREGRFRTEGRKALARVARLYATGDSAAEETDAVIALGDWDQLSGDTGRAISAYKQAWSLLVTLGGGSSALAMAKLGRPSRVKYSFEDAPSSPGATALQCRRGRKAALSSSAP